MVGRYCGQLTGRNVSLTGEQVLINFHSDKTVESRGYLIHFAAVPYSKYTFLFAVFEIINDCLQIYAAWLSCYTSRKAQLLFIQPFPVKRSPNGELDVRSMVFKVAMNPLDRSVGKC